MRVLAVVERPGRLGLAAAGLALRGHEVAWIGAAPAPADLEPLIPIGRARELWRTAVDAVVSDAARPFRPALAGWQARAVCQVHALVHEEVRRWRFLDRLAWGSLQALGLIEPGEAELFRSDLVGLDHEHLALWSDAPPPHQPDAAHPDAEVLERACLRARARHRGLARRPAVFIDRDGTLVREVGYLSDPADLELLPGVPAALRALQAAGYALIVISNQSGVGRGLFPLSRVHEAMSLLRRRLRAQRVELDGIYFCPHRPDAGCACRKPGTALWERAADDLHLASRASFMIGDKQLDVAMARRAGGRGLLVRTGYGRDEEQRGPLEGGPPDGVFDDLAAAAAWIVSETESLRPGA